MNTFEEQILLKIISQEEREKTTNLQHVIRRLRKQSGKFTEAEALLHMMDALIAEATGAKGW